MSRSRGNLRAVPDAPVVPPAASEPRLTYAPDRRVNPLVEPARWPFSETKKADGDVVITNIGKMP